MFILATFARPTPKPFPIFRRTITYSVYVIDETSGMGISKQSLTLGKNKINLTTNEEGLVTYSMKVFGPFARRQQLVIPESSMYSGVNKQIRAGRNYIQLTPKQEKTVLARIILNDQVSKKILNLQARLMKNGQLLGVFYGLNINLGAIKLYNDQVQLGDMITIATSATSSYMAVNNTLQLQAMNIIPVPRVAKPGYALGFIMYDATTLKRVQNVPITIKANNQTMTQYTDMHGQYILEANQQNKLWSGDMLNVQIQASGYQQQNMTISFPKASKWQKVLLKK
uniref:Uncharacterized protein n=1 Tax=Trepomonas sp. PC1 TaxID=1076344 RepID=A0A146K0R4_9EUKA|eukprot:JAP89374.1 Hypothetical protein TPC1_31131 [Trepomonas sp. PC1]